MSRPAVLEPANKPNARDISRSMSLVESEDGNSTESEIIVRILPNTTKIPSLEQPRKRQCVNGKASTRDAKKKSSQPKAGPTKIKKNGKESQEQQPVTRPEQQQTADEMDKLRAQLNTAQSQARVSQGIISEFSSSNQHLENQLNAVHAEVAKKAKACDDLMRHKREADASLEMVRLQVLTKSDILRQTTERLNRELAASEKREKLVQRHEERIRDLMAENQALKAPSTPTQQKTRSVPESSYKNPENSAELETIERLIQELSAAQERINELEEHVNHCHTQPKSTAFWTWVEQVTSTVAKDLAQLK